MWRSLADPELVATYRREFPHGSCPERLAALLADLSGRDYAGQVFAVTSLHKLRLTTAPTWQESEQHDCVFLGLGRDLGTFTVSYLHRSEREAGGRACPAAEVGGLVDLYVYRLLTELHNRGGAGG